ncbi:MULTISPECIES: lytic transglycosylase domain-containing protein [unclassified Nocardioides]|uniref:lytic transglycosylase domain-containing protein n=1 Tax=unclassified Nocardioides TaxID=2615069 RepID=UPI0006F364DC|nr:MULTISPECIES: lytic transglycosylase domain-containing protein [unclassified Nocardioides]KRA39507.1 hypothetical protein ASD81_11050 [Nocardioides sp. Root614]KRA93472.1 hypothetical protein ASD84_11315 [Nocardioides sp. Root682]
MATDFPFVWWQRLSVLLPVVALSVASTTTIAGLGATSNTSVVASADAEASLPVLKEAIEAPTGVSVGGGLGLGVDGDTQQIIASSTTNGISAAALAAYQRAASVINSADESCNLTWQLIAAIGRVESNHGRFGGNVLDDDGVAQPGIFGIALDGSNNTAVISDTDAGKLDNDSSYDRAVGPMQFIASTWSVVGVDADGDGQRDPQDIDDAALATAVYLCSGDDDLSATAGQRAAVYRYNHSQAYVDLVLSIMNAYSDGDFMSVPTSGTAAGVIASGPTYVRRPTGGNNRGQGQPRADNTGGQEPSTPTKHPEPTDPPIDPPGDGGNNGGNDGGGKDSPDAPTIRLPPLPTTSIDPVDDLLTVVQAVVQCTLNGHLDNILVRNDPFDRCVRNFTQP